MDSLGDGLLMDLMVDYLDKKDLGHFSCVNRRYSLLVKRNKLKDVLETKIILRNKNIYLPNHTILQILKLKKFDKPSSIEMAASYRDFRISEYERFSDPTKIIKAQARSKKLVQLESLDKDGRPILIIRPSLHIPTKNNDTLLYAVYMFEHVTKFVWNSGINEFTVILDFDSFTSKNFDFQFARTFITWSRKYFKNLLGACHCIRVPSYAKTCWNVCKLFVPAETIKKIHIYKKNEWKQPIINHFNINQLPIEYQTAISSSN